MIYAFCKNTDIVSKCQMPSEEKKNKWKQLNMENETWKIKLYEIIKRDLYQCTWFEIDVFSNLIKFRLLPDGIKQNLSFPATFPSFTGLAKQHLQHTHSEFYRSSSSFQIPTFTETPRPRQLPSLLPRQARQAMVVYARLTPLDATKYHFWWR